MLFFDRIKWQLISWASCFARSTSLLNPLSWTTSASSEVEHPLQKADDRQNRVSCPSEESSARSSSVRRSA